MSAGDDAERASGGDPLAGSGGAERRTAGAPSAMDPALVAALADADELVFLCSGNIVRSAFAELYLRHLLERAGVELRVRSAATTYDNDALYAPTRRALEARGVAAAALDAFRPQRLERVELGPRAVVLAMTREHLAHVPELVAAGRAFLVACALGRDEEVADPMFHGGFEGAFDRIARCVEALAEAAGARRPFRDPPPRR